MPLETSRRTSRDLALFIFLALLLSEGSALLYAHVARGGLLSAVNNLGSLASGVLQGRGLASCDASGAHCSRGLRMPVSPLFLAALYRIFGAHTALALAAKSLAVILPVLYSASLAATFTGDRSAKAVRWALGLLLLTLALPPMLNLVANFNFEEAFLFSPLCLAFAVVFFSIRDGEVSARTIGILAASLCLSYLCKSSVLLLVVTIAACVALYLLRQRQRTAAVLLLLAPLATTAGWGGRQWHATGHFSVGTSMDGVSLYRGNNSIFPMHYPPSSTSLPPEAFDGPLMHSVAGGSEDEWTISSRAVSATVSFIRSHPGQTMRMAAVKAWVFFFGITAYRTESRLSPSLQLLYQVGFVLFRILLWGAILAASLCVRRSSPTDRLSASVFLLGVVTLSVPYIVGMANIRHASVLILPSTFYLLRSFDVAALRLRRA